jgi:hypothetical protein
VAFQKPFVAWSAGRIQNFLELTFSVVVEPPERIVNVQNVRVLKQHGIRRLGNTVVSVSQIVKLYPGNFQFSGARRRHQICHLPGRFVDGNACSTQQYFEG